MSPVNVAVVGAGRIARAHVPALLEVPDARVAGILDANEAAAEHLAREHGIARVFHSWPELLDGPDVDAVAVLLPHHLHARFAVEAVRSGRHVVVEKPLAMSLAEADEMLDAAARAGRRLFAVQNRVYDPGIEAAKRLLDTNAVGDVFLAQTTGYESDAAHVARPWLRADVQGVLMAQSVHEAYLLRWLVGEVARVSCFFSSKRPVDIAGQHTAVVGLEFVDGAVGEMTATFSAVHGPSEHSVTIFGSGGFLQVTRQTWPGHVVPPGPRRHFAYRVRAISPGHFGDPGVHDLEVPEANAFQRMWADYVQAMATGGPSRVTGEDGRKAIEVMLAAHISAEEGRAVSLPL